MRNEREEGPQMMRGEKEGSPQMTRGEREGGPQATRDGGEGCLLGLAKRWQLAWGEEGSLLMSG